MKPDNQASLWMRFVDVAQPYFFPRIAGGGRMTLLLMIMLLMALFIVVFFLMIWAYVYTFHPKNKEKLESQRHIPLDDDNDAEDTRQ